MGERYVRGGTITMVAMHPITESHCSVGLNHNTEMDGEAKN